ncbi:MAG: hypothetical protein R3C28_26175 [Pirellulaceae bacterium]
MLWSIKLFTVAGIGVFVHWTFWGLLAWIFLAHLISGNSPAVAAEGVGFILALFLCVVLHELGQVANASLRLQDTRHYIVAHRRCRSHGTHSRITLARVSGSRRGKP